jgi:uncharacterized protein (DUF983 family)
MLASTGLTKQQNSLTSQSSDCDTCCPAHNADRLFSSTQVPLTIGYSCGLQVGPTGDNDVVATVVVASVVAAVDVAIVVGIVATLAFVPCDE